MGSFERARQEELPRWLADDVGKGYQRALGRRQDAELRLLKDALLASFPATAPADALPLLAIDYGTEQAPPAALGGTGETDEAFRARLDQMIPVHLPRAGTSEAYRDVLAALGVQRSGVLVFRYYEAYFRAAPERWHSQVYTLIESATHPWTVRHWGDGWTWGGAAAAARRVWGCDMTVAARAFIRREIRRRKSAHAYPVALYVHFGGGPLWGSPRRWGDGWVYSKTAAAMRLRLGYTWGDARKGARETGAGWVGSVRRWGQPSTKWTSFPET